MCADDDHDHRHDDRLDHDQRRRSAGGDGNVKTYRRPVHVHRTQR